MTKNGTYRLTMITIVATIAGNVRGTARQSYGSLSAAIRDAREFVQHGENRRAEVHHVAANGVESERMFEAVSPTTQA